MLESCLVGCVLQPGNIVGSPDSLGSISVGQCKVQRQYRPDQSVVNPELSASHGTSHTDVPDVSLVDDDEVYLVPVFRPRKNPGSPVLVCHPEQGIGDAEAVLCTLAEEEQAIVIDLAYSGSAQNAFPAPVVPSHPHIKVSKDDKFVARWG